VTVKNKDSLLVSLKALTGNFKNILTFQVRVFFLPAYLRLVILRFWGMILLSKSDGKPI
jgi:hypothetical protein